MVKVGILLWLGGFLIGMSVGVMSVSKGEPVTKGYIKDPCIKYWDAKTIEDRRISPQYKRNLKSVKLICGDNK